MWTDDEVKLLCTCAYTVKCSDRFYPTSPFRYDKTETYCSTCITHTKAQLVCTALSVLIHNICTFFPVHKKTTKTRVKKCSTFLKGFIFSEPKHGFRMDRRSKISVGGDRT